MRERGSHRGSGGGGGGEELGSWAKTADGNLFFLSKEKIKPTESESDEAKEEEEETGKG